MSAGTVLLTLGRLPKVVDVARAFAALGWRVVVADPFPRHMTGASNAVARSVRVAAPASDRQRYLADLLRIVEEEAVDLVLPVSEETLYVALLDGRLPPATRLGTMPPAALMQVHDKGRFAADARAWGLRAPETHPLGDPAAAALAARGEVVVKPLHAFSGRGLRFLEPGEAVPAPDPADPAIVQARIRGEEFSTCSLVQGGAVRGTAVYRGIMMSGTVAIAFERVEHPAILRWVEAFAARTGWTGFLSFDFIVDAAGVPWGIECNPRITSGLHFFARDDLARAILDPAQPLRLRPETRLQQFYPCLTETQLSLFRGGGFLRNLRCLLTTPDVTWSLRDPMPFLTMMWTSWPIIRMAIARRATFGEVVGLDIAWPGASGAVSAAPAAP